MESTSSVEVIHGSEIYEHYSVILVWVVKTGGLLSMIATTLTIRDILLRFLQGETIRLTSTLIFEWALACLGASFWSAFLSTWMVPEESGIFMASGNTATCTLQGFLDNFFYGTTVLTYTVLSFTYCFLVKFKRKDELLPTRSLVLVLGISPVSCFLLATSPLFDKAYNYSELHICSIAEYPIGCLSNMTSYDCERGGDARNMWISRFFIVCCANFLIIASVVVLVKATLTRENRINRHVGTATSLTDGTSRSRKVISQGIWYILAFEISWGGWYAWQFIRISAERNFNSHEIYSAHVSAILYFVAFTHPTQGVWISMVYFRPQYLKYRERDASDFRIASVLRALNLGVPRFLAVEWWESWRVHGSTKNSNKGKEHSMSNNNDVNVLCSVSDDT